MSNIETGGPAFPTLGTAHEQYTDESGFGRVRTVQIDNGGMTMRDYFAAKAMQGMCAANDHAEEVPRVLADWAYGMADAMLKAREA